MRKDDTLVDEQLPWALRMRKQLTHADGVGHMHFDSELLARVRRSQRLRDDYGAPPLEVVVTGFSPEAQMHPFWRALRRGWSRFENFLIESSK